MFQKEKKPFLAIKSSVFQSPKNCIFSKGVNPCFWSKNVVFFLELFSVKIRLEIMFNNVLERKETFLGHKKNVIFQSSKNLIFPKGLTHAFCQKMQFFFQLFSVKVRLEIMFNNVLERKETFFGHKKFNLLKSQKSHFPKGVNQCFWSKNVVFFLSCFRSK